MTYLAAYDGRPLGTAALERAAEFARDADEDLVVAAVVPTDGALAASYDLADGDGYDPAAAVERLRTEARSIAPDGEFRPRRVDPYAGRGRIAREIGHVIDDVDADLVVVGSDNAGRVVGPVASVGSQVAADTDYDVLVVRSA